MNEFRNTFGCPLAVLIVFIMVECIMGGEPILWTPDAIGDSMVLQANEPLPIFGDAPINRKITVRIADRKKTTYADENGKWRVVLDEMDYGGPFELRIDDGVDSLVFKDILVGEVWLLSGQSNMEWTLDRHKIDPPESDIPRLRWLKTAPQKYGKRHSWNGVNSANVAEMVAVAYFFGRELIDSLDVAVGLIISSDGGTKIHAWSGPEECMMADDDVVAVWDYRQAIENGNDGWFGLYDRHIAPHLGFRIAGVLWWQGEGDQRWANNYLAMLTRMIHCWRRAWGQDFPFISVQLPTGGGISFDGQPEALRIPRPVIDTTTLLRGPLMREAYQAPVNIMNNVVFVNTSDLEGKEHPGWKDIAGKRLANAAFDMVYERPGVFCGPLYKNHSIQGRNVRLRFFNVGAGLVAVGSVPLQGFEIFDQNGTVEWGDAVIDGDEIIVSHENVSQPAAVRYCWDVGLDAGNLFNADGFPATPFRTDGPLGRLETETGIHVTDEVSCSVNREQRFDDGRYHLVNGRRISTDQVRKQSAPGIVLTPQSSEKASKLVIPAKPQGQ